MVTRRESEILVGCSTTPCQSKTRSNTFVSQHLFDCLRDVLAHGRESEILGSLSVGCSTIPLPVAVSQTDVFRNRRTVSDHARYWMLQAAATGRAGRLIGERALQAVCFRFKSVEQLRSTQSQSTTLALTHS